LFRYREPQTFEGVSIKIQGYNAEMSAPAASPDKTFSVANPVANILPKDAPARNELSSTSSQPELNFNHSSTSFEQKTTMTQLNPTHLSTKASPTDSHYWSELKRAISDTSGFKRWVLERGSEAKGSETSQDTLHDAMVQLYLRQTLETLAY
jgi:hypothetical protein